MSNRMTSTSINVGLTEGTRVSSRVLRPPGGGHTNIFGGEPEPTRGRRPAPSVLAAQAEEAAKATNGATPTENGQAAPETPPALPTPPQEQAPQPKAEIPRTPVNPEPAKAEPPKRVRVPPGGFSSGLW